MRGTSLSAGILLIVITAFCIIPLVSPTLLYSTDDVLTAFLKNIGYFGQTKDEFVQKIGEPDAVTHDASRHSVTTYYYAGMEAVFDTLTGRISRLSITDNAWTVDAKVTIGATKKDISSALGDEYCRLTGNGGRDVWVYFCLKPSSDTEAVVCEYCRVCYIFFENGRVPKIVWSTEILGGYEMGAP